MVQCFTSLLRSNGITRITAPLNAGTLLDVQICPRRVGDFIDPLADLGTISMTVDGVEVLPKGFPLRWLVQVLNAGGFRYPDRRLSLNCWGAGSNIEVELLPNMSFASQEGDGYIAVFRYDTIITPMVGIPYRYHVAKKPLTELLKKGGPMQLVDMQREFLRGAPVGVAVDWCFLARVPDGARVSANLLQRGVLDDFIAVEKDAPGAGCNVAYTSRERVKGALDGLTVEVSGTMTTSVSLPLGVVRPSLRQSLEDSLLRLPPQFGNTVTVKVAVPLEGFIPMMPAGDSFRPVVDNSGVEFTSVLIERVKERNRV